MRRLAKTEAGFGLIELLIAMTVMVIAIMAIVAAFNSGMVALNRASHASTAATLADIQMESFRKGTYASIAPSTSTPSGPDGLIYRLESLVVYECPPGAGTLVGTTCSTGPGSTRPAVKVVTVVVSDPATTPARELFRETSNFDQATG